MQDTIALVLENNIDIEVARYGPITSSWRVERAQAGGALPGVPSSAGQAGSVAIGQGVAGSQAAAGVSIAGAGNNNSGAGNATISQVGPVAQTLDPSIQEATVFSHKTAPQPDAVQSINSVLISNTRVDNASIQEGFLSGGSVSLTYNNHYLNENAPTDVLNPSNAPTLTLAFQQNLLRGLGLAVNERNIRVSKINLSTSDLNFKTQVIGTVTQVLNLYYGLVADYEDVKAKTSVLETARVFHEENRKRFQIGTLAALDVTRSEAQVASSEQDLVVSQTNLQQREIQLKNMLSRNGLADPMLATVSVMPVDRIAIPDKDDLPPWQELVQKAIAGRSDLAAEKAGITTAETSAIGTKNGLLPASQVFGAETNSGLSGTARKVGSGAFAETADPYFVGGINTGLGQIFRRDFPTERIGVYFAAPLGNRQAQADYGIDQLQIRQSQLTTQRDINQVAVDVLNNTIALRQARVRYDAAVKNRTLVEQLLDAERKKFALGASTPYDVIQQQRDLATALSTEIAAMAAYSNARVALDQTLGATLEANHISLDAARSPRQTR